MSVEWPVWRLIVDGNDTLATADTYELLDIIQANEALDAYQEAKAPTR